MSDPMSAEAEAVEGVPDRDAEHHLAVKVAESFAPAKDDTPAIAYAKALVRAQAAVATVDKGKWVDMRSRETREKNRTAPVGRVGTGYWVASAEDVIGACRQALHTNGLSAYQTSAVTEGGRLIAKFRVLHVGGHSEDLGPFDMPIEAGTKRPKDKATAAAETYRLQYFLRGLLQVKRVREEEDVGQRKDGRTSKTTSKPKARQGGDTAHSRERATEELRKLIDWHGEAKCREVIGDGPKAANAGQRWAQVKRIKDALGEVPEPPTDTGVAA